MKTALIAIFAVWSACLTLLIAGGLSSPWNMLNIAVPCVILLATLSRDVHAPIRFAVICGALQHLLFPYSGNAIFLGLLVLALALGPLYRMAYSLPTLGSAFMSSLVGTLMFCAVDVALHIPMYYEIGFPGFAVLSTRFLVLFGFAFVCVAIGSQVYRMFFLRRERAFL